MKKLKTRTIEEISADLAKVILIVKDCQELSEKRRNEVFSLMKKAQSLLLSDEKP